MSQVKRAFIGGPWDGRVELIDSHAHVVDVPVSTPAVAFRPFGAAEHLWAEGCSEHNPTEARVVRYEIMPFSGDQTLFRLFVQQGITPDDVMRRLLARYVNGAL
jgi:hypothetical protein